MSKIFLTSDQHFGHDREFIWKARGFSCVKEMNETYVERWNKVVCNDDKVYLLGDVMLGDSSNIDYVKQLNGEIHIVLGNHDTDNRIVMYNDCPNIVETMWAQRLRYHKYSFYLSHFPTMTANLEKESLKQCTCNLYGHTHQTNNFYNDIPFMYHVGVDSHNGCPVLLDDIIEEMKQKFDECKQFLDLEEQEKIYPRCDKCVNIFPLCGHDDIENKCPKYKRDPPDGGYYG